MMKAIPLVVLREFFTYLTGGEHVIGLQGLEIAAKATDALFTQISSVPAEKVHRRSPISGMTYKIIRSRMLGITE